MNSRAGPMAVGTLVSSRYLAHARVLAQSFLQRHPLTPFFLILAGQLPGAIELAADGLQLIRLEDIGAPQLPALLFSMGASDACDALRPWALQGLLDRGFQSAVLLDADMLVLDDLSEVLDQVAGASVCLTPFHLGPLSGAGSVERERALLSSGVMNDGFVGVSEGLGGGGFLRWWADRAAAAASPQKWLDLAPALFEGAQTIRDPGVNVAYWNLAERGLEPSGAGWSSGGRPCRLFHFSGFDPEQPDRVSRHSDWEVSALGAAGGLFRTYAEQLIDAGYTQAKDQPWPYDVFSDGDPIPEVARQLYREHPDRGRFGDPFDAGRTDSFRAWLSSPPDGARGPASRFWRRVYELRPDVRAVFPDLDGADAERFFDWALTSGSAEHGVPPSLWPPVPRGDEIVPDDTYSATG